MNSRATIFGDLLGARLLPSCWQRQLTHPDSETAAHHEFLCGNLPRAHHGSVVRDVPELHDVRRVRPGGFESRSSVHRKRINSLRHRTLPRPSARRRGRKGENSFIGRGSGGGGGVKAEGGRDNNTSDAEATSSGRLI